MKILICDDEAIWAEQLDALCRSLIDDEKSEDVEDVLTMTRYDETAARAFEPDLLLLDIEMPGKSGLAIKEEREALGQKGLIVFVTSHGEAMPQAFGKNVIGFLEKPVSREILSKLLEKTKRLLTGGIHVTLAEGRRVPAEAIRYITVENIYSTVYLKVGEAEVRRSLREWEQILPQGDFIRISDKCIVNCRYILNFTDDSVLLDGGLRLRASRRRRKSCQERYWDYCCQMARYV